MNPETHDIDTRLREWGHAARLAADDTDLEFSDLGAASQTQSGRRPRRGVTVAAVLAAAGVAAGVAGLTWMLTGPIRHKAAAPATSTEQSTPALTPDQSKAQSQTPFLRCGMSIPAPASQADLSASIDVLADGRSVQLTVSNDGQSTVGLQSGMSVVLVDASSHIVATDNTIKPASISSSPLEPGSSKHPTEAPRWGACPDTAGAHPPPDPGAYTVIAVFSTSNTYLSSVPATLTINPDQTISAS